MPQNVTLAQDQWYRYIYCRDRGHHDFVEKADRCEQFFAGNQWRQEDMDALKEANRPAMTINKIMSTLSTMFGEQIFNRTEVLFRPLKASPADVAEALTMVWQQISQNNQLSWLRSDVFADGIIRSRGFYDARLDFSDNIFGEVRITKLNSKNVIIDPDAEDQDPDTWNDVIITKWMTPDDVSTLYNKEDGDILRERAMSIATYGADSLDRYRDTFAGLRQFNGVTPDKLDQRRSVRVLDRQYRRMDNQLHFVDTVTGDMRPVPTDWKRDRIAAFLEKAGPQLTTAKRLVKRVRWTVTSDDIVLHDDWSPYKRLTVVPYFPHFRYGKTIGAVENLIGPQEILNKTSSQELHIINTTANSGWTVEEDSLTNMTVGELEVSGAKTGLVLEYRKGSQPPGKILPNQVPTGLDRVSMKSEEHIKTISGVSDSMQGFDRADVPAKAIAYKQQRGAVGMSKMLDNLERADYFLARHVLEMVQEYYTGERIVRITKDDFTNESQEITVNQFDPVTGVITNDLTLGEYSIVITSSPYRASLEDSQFEQARALREIGVAIPDDVLIENSRLLRRAELVKRLQQQAQSPEAQAAAQLQLRGAQAQVALTEANIGKTQANAQMLVVKAKKEAAEIGEDPNGGGDDGAQAVEGVRLRAEMETAQDELDLKKYEIDQKLKLERYKFEKQHELDVQKLKQEAAAARADRLRKPTPSKSKTSPSKQEK